MPITSLTQNVVAPFSMLSNGSEHLYIVTAHSCHPSIAIGEWIIKIQPLAFNHDTQKHSYERIQQMESFQNYCVCFDCLLGFMYLMFIQSFGSFGMIKFIIIQVDIRSHVIVLNFLTCLLCGSNGSQPIHGITSVSKSNQLDP